MKKHYLLVMPRLVTYAIRLWLRGEMTLPKFGLEWK